MPCPQWGPINISTRPRSATLLPVSTASTGLLHLLVGARVHHVRSDTGNCCVWPLPSAHRFQCVTYIHMSWQLHADYFNWCDVWSYETPFKYLHLVSVCCKSQVPTLNLHGMTPDALKSICIKSICRNDILQNFSECYMLRISFLVSNCSTFKEIKLFHWGLLHKTKHASIQASTENKVLRKKTVALLFIVPPVLKP